MTTAFNNFYVIQPCLESFDPSNELSEVCQYSCGIDLSVWRNPVQMRIGKVVSRDSSEPAYVCLEHEYSKGDIVLYDPSKAIHVFDDNSVLIREDGIACLFDNENHCPLANKYQVVVKLDLNNLEFQDISKTGFYGEVIDIMPSTLDGNIKIGDNVILVCAYEMTNENLEYTFKKIATHDAYYVVSDCGAIACKLNE